MKRITKIISSAAALSSIIALTPFTASAEDVTETSITTSVVSSEKTTLESTLPASSDIATTITTSKNSTITPEDVEKSEDAEASTLPQGNGFLLEDVLDENVNRQFLTIQSKNGNTFYIVVDKDSEGRDNVYFMNLVDEYDLMAFADKFPSEDKDGSKKKAEVSIDKNEEMSTNAENEDIEADDEQPLPVKKSTGTASKNLLVPAIGIFALVGGAALYFFKFKGASAKNDKKNDFNDDDFDDSETIDDEE